MRLHWHAGPEDILLYGLSAILVINVVRLIAGNLSASNSPAIQRLGAGIGAAVH